MHHLIGLFVDSSTTTIIKIIVSFVFSSVLLRKY